jgi:hypothetical protein
VVGSAVDEDDPDAETPDDFLGQFLEDALAQVLRSQEDELGHAVRAQPPGDVEPLRHGAQLFASLSERSQDRPPNRDRQMAVGRHRRHAQAEVALSEPMNLADDRDVVVEIDQHLEGCDHRPVPS